MRRQPFSTHDQKSVHTKSDARPGSTSKSAAPKMSCFKILSPRSMTEVPDAGEHHRQSPLVGGGNDFLIADAASGLDYGDCAVVGDHVEAVTKREERVRGHHGSCQRQAAVRRLE